MAQSNEPQPVKTTIHEGKKHDMPPMVAPGEKNNVTKIIILGLLLALMGVCAVGGGYLALYTGIFN